MAHDLMAVVRSSKYPLDAFLFVQRGLDFTVKRLHGEEEKAVDDESGDRPSRHVTGRDLCHGLRDFAIQQYGLLARTVLKRWHIHTCEDFGRIVFAMVDAGLMNKTDEDSISDFIGVFDFATAFTDRLELSAPGKKTI